MKFDSPAQLPPLDESMATTLSTALCFLGTAPGSDHTSAGEVRHFTGDINLLDDLDAADVRRGRNLGLWPA